MVEGLQYSGFNYNYQNKIPEFDKFETKGLFKWVKTYEKMQNLYLPTHRSTEFPKLFEEFPVDKRNAGKNKSPTRDEYAPDTTTCKSKRLKIILKPKMIQEDKNLDSIIDLVKESGVESRIPSTLAENRP